jgi:DNA-directed RNA polymerase I, II, and III subunit RPABC1
MEADEVTRLFRVWRTLHQMLRDRGYVIDPDQLELGMEEFQSKLGDMTTREPLVLHVQRIENADDRLFVFFPDEARITVPVIVGFAQRLHKESMERCIIIGKGSITASARQGINELSTNFMIEYFEDRELLVNITEHELVPEHIVLSDSEKQDLLKKYRVKESQLPKIQINDPVARYFGLIKGQVVKIIRSSETAGRYVTYRLAV